TPACIRRTVIPSPRRSHARPSRGSTSTALVIRYPSGVLGSIPSANPLFGLPVFGTIAPTKPAVGPPKTNNSPVVGSIARRDAVGHVAGGVKGTAQALTYSATALPGSKRVGSKFEPCPSICSNGECQPKRTP